MKSLFLMPDHTGDVPNMDLSPVGSCASMPMSPIYTIYKLTHSHTHSHTHSLILLITGTKIEIFFHNQKPVLMKIKPYSGKPG
jgi:hypothetical protein